MVASRTPRKRRTKAEMAAAQKRRESATKYRLKIRHRMTMEEYEALKEYQGGVCYICRFAKGIRRLLQVDHDHKKAKAECAHPHEESCRNCWRGLLCGTCNTMLGRARDIADVFRRAIEYLEDPPAQRWLRERTKKK